MSEENNGKEFDEREIEAFEKMHEKDSGGSEVSTLHIGTTYKFPRVEFSGKYGLFCGSYQTFERCNITKHQAKMIKETYFGVCESQVIFYDNGNNVIDTWN